MVFLKSLPAFSDIGLLSKTPNPETCEDPSGPRDQRLLEFYQWCPQFPMKEHEYGIYDNFFKLNTNYSVLAVIPTYKSLKYAICTAAKDVAIPTLKLQGSRPTQCLLLSNTC